MKNPNGPPDKINLPPIIIKPDQPLPRLPSAPLPPVYTAKPLPWNGKIIETREIKTLFSKKNIKHPDQTIAIIVAIATQQDILDKAYNAHTPFFRRELDEEIAHKSGPGKPTALEQYKLEKSIADQLLELKKSELQQSTATANLFYRRNPFNKDIKKNAVDFVNIFHKSREPSLTTYNKWLTSITAAYTAKMLAAKTKILAEKSKQLASTITTTEAEEKKYLDTWSNRYNQEKKAITSQYQLDKGSLEKRLQTELNTAEKKAGSTVDISQEQRLTKTISIIEKLVEMKQKELQRHLSLLAGHPGKDLINQDSKAFVEHTRLNHLDPEASLKKELSALYATYQSDILNAEINNLETRLIRLVPEQEKLIEQRANSGVPPLSPPNIMLIANMEEARKLKDASKIIVGGDAVTFGIFYTKVRNKGEWDYKQHGREFEEFGNFNYGATGTAAGISEQILLRAAGAAQSIAGTSKEEFGKWWAESPYGDDKIDQIWIKAGIAYAKTKGF
ncbi:polymorphic toxin type 44 domain-containing protein [Pseudomonas sp. G2-4]|uniref:polymorphic toxin type 44 domain-containing protein n=1 Tax=Pseudomonas sp. G2-4 TaxID=1506334 RepID=UPI0024BBA77E|nr:polymorphic toxin type 44 domain-containing protein [Pseudomonas sp. G2-4]WHS62388.1 polymorphic toxin type 44 domain-containing protein [Pseudomonas sp. G2-4]